MAAPSLSLLVLKTHQVQKLCSFYASIGLSFCEEQHGRGPVHFAAEFNGIVLEIYPLADDAIADQTTRLGFVVADLQQVLRHLADQELCDPPQPRSTDWGERSIVRDPDGRAVELYQRAPPAS